MEYGQYGIGLLESLEIPIFSYQIISQASVFRSLKGHLPTNANTLARQNVIGTDWLADWRAFLPGLGQALMLTHLTVPSVALRCVLGEPAFLSLQRWEAQEQPSEGSKLESWVCSDAALMRSSLQLVSPKKQDIFGGLN